ncbi:MAG: Fur family transcriptional regulator [Ferrimicrobium sp.]
MEPSTPDLIDRLRDRGWRLSAQRRVVAEVLCGEHLHLTADEVHRQAREVLPEISTATVYNTLRELVGMGEVRVVSADDGPKRYDPNVTQAHHHLVCTTCGTLRDIHPHGELKLALPTSEQFGFQVSTVDITFRGQCPRCQRNQ